MAIRLKRVYEPPDPDDGERYLVERLWPRGIRQADLQLTAWLRDVAPSHELRRWYGHDPTKWPAFQARYLEELRSNPAAWEPLLRSAQRGTITLLYSARDTERNSAVVLRAFLEEQLSQRQRWDEERSAPSSLLQREARIEDKWSSR
ncbi:MAG: DUF488 family protein [Thermomicrobium sp.]|nr:DUF488 family protein [Thermomicrobium sp.]